MTDAIEKAGCAMVRCSNFDGKKCNYEGDECRFTEAEFDKAELAALRADNEAQAKQFKRFRETIKQIKQLREAIVALQDAPSTGTADAWVEYIDARGAAIKAGLDLVDRTEPLVEKYTLAAECLEATRAGLDRLFAPLGPHAGKVVSGLRRANPEPKPTDPEDLDTLRIASRLRSLFRKDAS